MSDYQSPCQKVFGGCALPVRHEGTCASSETVQLRAALAAMESDVATMRAALTTIRDEVFSGESKITGRAQRLGEEALAIHTGRGYVPRVELERLQKLLERWMVLCYHFGSERLTDLGEDTKRALSESKGRS